MPDQDTEVLASINLLSFDSKKDHPVWLSKSEFKGTIQKKAL